MVQAACVDETMGRPEKKMKDLSKQLFLCVLHPCVENEELYICIP